MNDDSLPSQDLAPTLAFLTGISIPENNLGALIPDLMLTSTDHHEWDGEAAETAAAFYNNAIQVSRVMKSNLGEEAMTKSKIFFFQFSCCKSSHILTITDQIPVTHLFKRPRSYLRPKILPAVARP